MYFILYNSVQPSKLIFNLRVLPQHPDTLLLINYNTALTTHIT